ncbi:Crp/Fnr family transcriptional regulator [Marinobacter oulmenensis]|uniref:CRP-like cAMP-binding protein n=1 Tax=Marinobacter oulmenensis TaxID=643747 RepID=A0A840UC51_9GAMM|nr:Crp/Fnr family transcriptional regulator [Marinobacter oulmenensis]MBB5320055.1 CRP-like cAMP-binding protein [Marinobacter oulmenensis]
MKELAEIELFRNLSVAQRESLCRDAVKVSVTKGEHLFLQGDRLSCYFLVLSGCVRLYRLGYEGHEKVYQELHGGMVFAETVAFQEERRAPLSAVTMQDSELMQLDSQHLRTLFETSPAFAMAIAHNMAGNLYSAVSRIDQLTVNKSGQRLVMFLAELYQDQHTRWLKLPFTQGILARQLNIEPETLSRTLSKFKEAGCLSVKARECVILDPERLCAMVNLPTNTFSNQHSGLTSPDLLRCCGIG